MSAPDEQTRVAISTQSIVFASSSWNRQANHITSPAAERFIGLYYEALQSQRATIASFYQNQETLPDGKVIPSIVYNGDVKADGTAMQKLFQEDMPQTCFEAQAVDAQCLNPNYIPEGTTGGHASSGKNLTILVTVNGYVKFGDPKTASMKGFSESFVLVPNQDSTGPRTRAKHAKDYVIQSQIFRIVV